jgi:hypothetical protein
MDSMWIAAHMLRRRWQEMGFLPCIIKQLLPKAIRIARAGGAISACADKDPCRLQTRPSKLQVWPCDGQRV